jgi:surfeit locus 1 family protein
VSEHVGSLPVRKPASFTLFHLFSRRWILATFLVIAGAAVLARLGVWQLDRLAQRRIFNTRVQAQMAQPQLALTGDALSADLPGMEYRSVVVRGQYDFSRQVALRNQAWDNQAGVHLLTPLRIDGTDTYVLVERGWVPGLESTPADWRQYDESGTVEVRGIIRRSQSKPDFGRRADPLPAPGSGPLNLWYFADVARVAAQLPYPLLPVYVQQAPDPAWTSLPYRSLPELDLTEGPHMSYALQWFSFAILLLIGYPFYVRKRERTH